MQTLEYPNVSLGILNIFNMEYGVSNLRKVKEMFTTDIAIKTIHTERKQKLK